MQLACAGMKVDGWPRGGDGDGDGRRHPADRGSRAPSRLAGVEQAPVRHQDSGNPPEADPSDGVYAESVMADDYDELDARLADQDDNDRAHAA
jgi:hypothetical protein